MPESNVLEELTQPGQDSEVPHPVVGVPEDFDPARVRELAPAGVPVAVADPAAGDMATLLGDARHFSDWVGFPRHDALRRYLAAAPAGGRPRGLYLWLTGYLEPGFATHRVPLVGVLAAIAGALLQGSGGFVAVWSAGLAVVAVAAVALVAEPAVTAGLRYARLLWVWHRMLAGTPHQGASLAGATRKWWSLLAAGRTIADPRCDRLLAGAYLTDLARAWHPGLWQPVWWFGAWRRDYPVLVIGPGPVRPGPVDVLLDAYHRLARRSVVLVLPEPLRLPAGMPEPVRVPATAGPPGAERVIAFAPPWWQARRWRGLGGAALVLALLAGSGWGLPAAYTVFDPCTWEADGVEEIGEERVGFQVCGIPFGPAGGDKPTAGGGTWEDRIYAENVALTTRRAAKRRDTLTVLVVTSLTRRGEDSSVVAETEGLAGAYAAQREINENEQIPQLRLVVVNAGDGGLLIEDALDEVAGYVEADRHRVIGALTTVDSTTISKTALKRLDEAGLVQLTPTMTADRIGEDMDRFYQLISPNSRQTEMVARYAIEQAGKDRRRDAAFFFVAPDDRLTGDGIEGDQRDLYVQTLREGVRKQRDRLAAAGMPLTEVAWRAPRGELSPVCTTRDRYSAVYYGGRYTEFTEFVKNLRDECAKAEPPALIGNSSVSRFLLDPALATDVGHGESMAIATRGPLLSCAQYTEKALAEGDLRRRRDFADAIDRYLGRCRGQASTGVGATALAGAWAANAYESVSLLHAAALRDAADGDAAADDPVDAVRERTHAVLGRNDIAHMGVVSPVTFVDRVGSQSVWLYRVKDLRTAFAGGKSPAEGSATPVACLGDAYEKCRKL